MFTFDRNLRTPYVLQWSFGLQRELSPSTALEVRYVANHAVKLFRGFDLNQIDILANGLLDEFLLAQENLACNRSNGYNRFDDLSAFFGCGGPLPILEAMDFPFYTSFIALLDNGEAGEFTHSVQRFATYFYLASGGALFPGLGAFPANFFRANPIVFNGDLVGNGSRSQYHGLQVEVRRRFYRGLQFQANYTWGKVLTDFTGSASEFEAFLDLRTPDFDKRRADFDIHHTFHANGIWEIPVGRGRTYASEGVIGKVLEGWQIGAIWTWRSGRPMGILSGRGTVNRSGRSGTRQPPLVLSGTAHDVCQQVGAHRNPAGITLLPASFIDSGTGEGSPAIFGHPAPGQLGDHFLRTGCSAPSVFDFDFNLIKRTFVTDDINFEFRFEVFNLFNTPNFLPESNYDIGSATFTQVTHAGNVYAGRQIQFNFRINF
jgi:hypothetical protein